MPLRAVEMGLSGWAGRPRERSWVVRPEHRTEVAEALRVAMARGSAVARGRGTAYGDVAMNRLGGVVATDRLQRLLAFQSDTGLLTCEAGVPLRDVVEFALPRGFFPAVTPGTWKATVGGCLACDVHGKNHHVAGSFAQHVTEFRLLTASGDVVVCTQEGTPELFWATAGGLGLTGVILDVTLRLRRVATSAVRVRYRKLADLDATFAALEEDEPEPYSVAWLDVLARGKKLGRSVLMLGDHAAPGELPPPWRSAPFALPPTRAIRLPFAPPPGVLSAPAVRLFNAFFYRRFSSRDEPVVQGLRPYFYPLEAIDNFNRLYGKPGFVEYQVALPRAAARDVFRTILERLSARGYGSFLAVVKRLGAGNQAPLSFPSDGYTVAIDIPARDERLFPILSSLDELVATQGGRVYLAKDARLDARLVDAMYPGRAEWAALLDRFDPERCFTSSLSRRLALRGH